MRVTPARERVRLLFHVSEGYTRVLPERFAGMALNDGSVGFDIPTHVIPTHLRGIGSCFTLVYHNVTADAGDSAEELRSRSRELWVEEC